MAKIELAILRILRQHGKLYGLEIHRRLKDEGLRWWQRGIGAFYVAIHRLEKAGYVKGEWGDDPPEVLAARGGNRRRYYSITGGGRKELLAAEKGSQGQGDGLVLLSISVLSNSFNKGDRDG